MRPPAIAAVLALAAVTSPGRSDGAEWTVTAPGGRVALVLKLDEAAGRLSYAVRCGDAAVLDDSSLGITRDDATFDAGLALVEAGPVTPHDEAFTLLHGKRREARDRHNAQVLTFRNGDGKKLEIHMRAYDDGVAFRYRFPEEDATPRTVTAEGTVFRLPGGSRVWAQPYDDPGEYLPAYESFWQFGVPAGTASTTRAGWAFPLLFRTPEGRWGLLTEADMDGSYCGSHLKPDGPGGLFYWVRFPDPGEGNGTGAVAPKSTLPWATPWRVVMVGETSAAPIVESTLIEALNPPAKVADTSWIQPGRAAWSWLFDPDSPQDHDRLVPFIDLAAEMGWEYVLIDANWDIMKNGTVHDLIARAKEKGVGVWFWYNSGGDHNVVTERPRGMMAQRKVRRYEFERLARWGVKGVKIDFFQSDKQDIMRLYREILEDAADYKIMVNFHGCTLPRGWSRTYPHLMSMEAVRGAENYLFEPRFPEYAPRHNATLPFTRNAVGPMDYTPTLFQDNRQPLRTTPGHEIALPVVFESGVLHFGGGPAEYLGLPDVPKQFLKSVPVVWDETRCLVADPGKTVVIARRSGDTWYVAGISGEDQERQARIDLADLLGRGTWTATIITDGAAPKSLVSNTREFEAAGTWLQPMKPRGGFAATLAPKR